MSRRCRRSGSGLGMSRIRRRSMRCATRRRVAAAADEARVGPEQAGDQPTEVHEALALLRQADLAVGCDGDVAGLALLVDAAIDRAHLYDITVNEGALQLGR